MPARTPINYARFTQAVRAAGFGCHQAIDRMDFGNKAMASSNSTNGPSQVLIVRHGEKLGDPSSDNDGGPHLSTPGSARATALPQLFAPAQPLYGCALSAGKGQSFTGNYVAVQIPGAAPRFSTPDFLFATQASKSSNRPVETITPLSTALNLTYDDKHADGDYAKVASDILTNSKYTGKVVLVCWHHGNIPNLATALGVTNPPDWPGSVFDRVWAISYSNGAASLANEAQTLLYGDSTS